MADSQVNIIANIITKVDNAEKGINKLKNGLSKLKIPDGIDKGLTKSFTNLEGIFERYRNQVSKGFKTKGDVSAFSKVGKELDAEMTKVSKYMSDLTGKTIDFKVNSEPIKQLEKDLTKLIERQQELTKTALNFKIGGVNGKEDNSIESLLKGIRKEAGDTKAGRAANAALANLQMGDVGGAKAKIDEIIASYKKLGQAKKDAEVAGSGMNILGAANAIKSQIDPATKGLQEVKNQADSAVDSLNKLRGDQMGKAANEANKLAKQMEQNATATNQANKAAQEYAQSSLRMTEQLNQLKSSTQYFFGLRNMLNLLKQGFREALNTVKELDAAMTETAVVTNFDVGDMWEKLPEYTANANALGATIQDMYKSTTLYYQQGLNAQQAMSIASETMKMARIGGLEATDATNMMTAALRGFNMELNSASAQRINDVYSNLAAKTASDTRELGEAMERTASIAHSAGMSFEGTSAFLAQMIETTREAPENLGTAMKTIVARFQELKKNPLEMQEVDGEEVSFNKVDSALQTIGVSLKDANGQFRELDQVFLDIASRWDNLSQTQQRFIATTAAGSRQQSRFIAMMNNYDRTVQLMNYANDSAGASNEQFGKTMESLEAKLNKLKNAWDLFRMGLASNNMIKGAVDGLTKIVNTVTKLIDTLSFGQSGLKSILTIFTAFSGLRMAGKGINALLGGLGGMLDPNSSILKGAFGGGLLGSKQGANATQAKLINQPIVNVLNQILGVVRGKTGNQNDSNIPGNYRQSLRDFRASANNSNATISGTLGTLKGLDNQQVRLISKSNVGTMRQLQRSLAQTDMGSILASQMVTAMKRGNISGNQAASLNKANIGAILGTKEAEQYSQAFVNTTKKELPQRWSNQIDSMRSAMRYSNKALWAETEGIAHEDLTRKFDYDKTTGEKSDNPLYNEKYAKYAKENLKTIQEANKQQAKFGDDLLKQKTPLEKVQNGLSYIGSGAITAGQGLMSLGNTLNSMGFEAAGAAVSSFGSALSNLGMIANGIPAMLSLLSNPVGAIAAVAGVGFGAIVLSAQATRKKIQEEAEKITDSFKQAQDETTANISNLKTWKEEMATLSKGVDENGLNVNLSDVDYAHYLEIVDAVAKMNPEIVKGYTAQGHAIIDNNKALEDTLKIQQQIQKKAIEDYLDDKALQKLIDARNINKDFQNATTKTVVRSSSRADFGPATMTQIKAAPLATDVQNLLSSLKNQKGLDVQSILKTYDIDLQQLEAGEQKAINQFVKFQDKINSDVSKAVSSSQEDLSDKVVEGFNKLSDNTAAFDEAIQPALQNLQTYASNLPGFDNIGDEFQTAISAGLKDIVIQPDLDATQMQDQARILIQQFDDLTREGGAYATAMEEIEVAQDQFASSLDASEYAKNTESALNTLNSLLKEYEGNTTAYGQAVTEYLTNQIEKIKNFTEEGATSLTEALNTATSEIAAAEGAYEAFQEATKTDMSTGAESMKSIYDEITKETDGARLHMQGKGDNTLWTGMSSLFSEEAVQNAAKKGGDAVQSMLQRIEPMLQNGKAGFDAFWRDMFSDDNYAKLKDIEGVMMDQENWKITWDDDLNPDVFHEMAEALGYSDEFLTSMLNKGRQFANLNFMDTSDVRKALSTDQSAIKGTSTSSIRNDEGKQETVTDIFVKEDYLKNALKDAQISNPAEQNQAIKDMQQNGIKIIPNAKDISEDTFKNMGISDIPSLIKTFGDTGQFNRSEIEEYAQQMQGYNAQEFGSLYQDYLDSQEHPELPTLSSIESNVQTIASILGSNRVEQGYADESTIQAYEEAKKAVNGENGHNKGEADSISELFALGKNREHEGLSESEYQSTLKLLDKQIDEYTRASQEYEKGAKKAEQEGRDADAKELLKEAHGYAELAKRLEEDKTKGEQVHQNLQNAEESTKQKAAGMPSDVNQILDKQTQAKQEQAEADQKRAEGLAKQTEEIVKQKEEQAAAEQKRAEGLVKQTEEYAKQKQEQEAKGQIDWQHSKENYEQQAKNASGPTKSLEAQAQEKIEKETAAVETGMSQQLNMIDIGSIKRLGGGLLEKFRKGFSSGVEEQTDKFVIGPEYAAYTGQASEAFNATFKEKTMELGSTLKDAWDSLTQAESSIPTQNTTFTSKVSTAAQKLGEALKQGYDALQGVQTPSSTPVAPTINQGASTLSTTTQEVVQKVVTQETGVDETQQKLENISSTADKGANMPVSAAMDATVSAAQTALQKLKDSASKGANVKTTVDSKGADGARSTASKAAEMPLKIKDLATPVINRINASARKTVTKTVNISPNYTGTWKKDVYVGLTGPGANKAATGVNNKISFHHVPLVGSLARGTKKGRVGPRGQGGPTLTGEEGYEIAWLPEESRSMILGANGPQMIDLPKDAIVWNHEQSKEIMKRRAIPFGSMGSGSGDYDPDGDGGSSGSKKSGSKKKKKKKSKKSSKKNKASSENKTLKNINNFSIEEVIRFDIDRNLEALTSNINKLTKDIDKNLGRIGTKATDISAKIKEQVANLQAVKKNNEDLAASYQRDLNTLDTGGYKTKVSYDVEETKKTKKKKKKKTKITKETVSKDEYINLSDYIYRDDNGNYQIDKDKIAQAGSKERQEAIFKAAESALNPLVSGLQKAKDAAEDAKDKIDDLANKVSETFYQWENEITEVYDLTQRLNKETSLRGRFASQVSLELAKLNSGFGSAASSISIMQKSLERDNKTLVEQLKNQQLMISARERELQAALSEKDEIEQLVRLRDKTTYNSDAEKKATVQWATDQYNATALGRKYLSNVRQSGDGSLQYEINWQQFESDRRANPYNKQTYDAIKKFLDELDSAAVEFNNAIKDQTDLIKETYDALKEYQDFIGDFEDTLIKGLEQEIESNIDNAKQLSDSITDALKDLLDEVKRKLDERRQEEENRKTEQDISQKQQRLAALRANTAGGNQVEIARLEQEIVDAQQSYGRTLEDQLLERLQTQADEAQRQRDQIIRLMEQQNAIATSNNRELVNMWLKDPAKYKEEIRNAWLEAQEYDEKGAVQQALLRQEFESGFTNLKTAIEQTGFNGYFTNSLTNMNTLIGVANSINNNLGGLKAQSNTTAKNTNTSAGTTQATLKTAAPPPAPPKAATPAKAATPTKTAAQIAAENAAKAKQTNLNAYQTAMSGVKNKKAKNVTAADVNMLFTKGAAAGFGKASVLSHLVGNYGGSDPFSWESLMKGTIIEANGIDRYNLVKTWPNDVWLEKGLKKLGNNPKTLAAIKANKKYASATALKFATGGLADYTGPAWLDGTRSKPELVLNAADTKNFIALKDVLAHAMNSAGHIENSYSGDATYEININVDHLNNDYDVDKVVERVKKKIIQDSGYRNVTQVRKLR